MTRSAFLVRASQADAEQVGAYSREPRSMAYLPGPTAMVGRVAELAALTAQLDEAAAGRGSIALVSGVPGIGKFTPGQRPG